MIRRHQASLLESQVLVVTDFQENLPPLKVDRQRLEQVIANLVINAAQAMTEGGQLLIRASETPPAVKAVSDSVMITVADTGPGIPADAQRRIFEPFFTTKTKGTGLGLPVARRIIEAHDGKINVTSEAGQGTRFIINLPLEKEHSL